MGLEETLALTPALSPRRGGSTPSSRDFHALWCGIASWELTAVATALAGCQAALSHFRTEPWSWSHFRSRLPGSKLKWSEIHSTVRAFWTVLVSTQRCPSLWPSAKLTTPLRSCCAE